MIKISKSAKLFICILICEGTGIISSLLSNVKDNAWFDTLLKPSWNPPAYLFAPVWTILYLMMAISLWMIWSRESSSSTAQERKIKSTAFGLFAAQLFLNFWWSIIFFKFHSTTFALVDIVLMVITIGITIYYFAKISTKAAALLIPYIAWVSFATMLNFKIFLLNG